MRHHRRSHASFDSSEERFLNELSKYSSNNFVDNDVIKEWITEYRENNDPALLNKILAQVTRFIMFIARKYKTPDIDIRDPIIEAIYGVIEAVDRYYNLDSKQKFVTYIKIIVERRVKDTCDKHKQAVELPKNILSEQGKLRKRNNGNQTIYSKINFQKVTDIKSLYQLLSSAVIYSDRALMKESLVYDINRILKVLLNYKERYIIISMFGLNDTVIRSIEMISEDLHIIPREVRELKMSALNKLRSDERGLLLLSKYLEDFN